MLIMKDKEIQVFFEAKKKILDLMDRNLDIRLNTYVPFKETFFDKLIKRIRAFLRRIIGF